MKYHEKIVLVPWDPLDPSRKIKQLERDAMIVSAAVSKRRHHGVVMPLQSFSQLFQRCGWH